MSNFMKRALIIWVLLIATVLVGGPYARELLLATTQPRAVTPRGDLADFKQLSTELFDAAAPTVVYIFTKTGSESPFEMQPLQSGAGSGFVWDGTGNMATNYHVVKGANQITVRINLGEAAINPGNSGGPLLDSAGRLIEVNTAIVSASGNSAGIGFAVPVDAVNRVVPKLIKDGRFPRPGIGISIVDEQTSARIRLPGIVLASVFPGTPAADAGLEGIDRRRNRLGDVITGVDGKPVQDLAEFTTALDEAGIDNEVELTVVRYGRERTVKLKAMDLS